MRKFVAYYRVSKDSHESGRSISRSLGLDAQQQIVEHFQKDSIVKTFTETKSAKNITERPLLQEAIKYCIENDCWLIVAKLDRLSRDVDDVRLIHKMLNKKISFCDIPSDGETDLFTITLFAAFAERERQLISLRTSQALQAKIKKDGKWQKCHPDMASGKFARMAGEAHKRNAETNENMIRAREVIMANFKNGLNYTQIAKILNHSKHLTPRGKLFSATQVRRIHKKTVDAGRI